MVKPNILFIFLFFCTVYSQPRDLICKHLCLKYILKAVKWKTKEERVVNVEFCIMILKVMQDELKLCNITSCRHPGLCLKKNMLHVFQLTVK